jgi:hypothetical protein
MSKAKMTAAVVNGIHRTTIRRLALNQAALAQASNSAFRVIHRLPLASGPMDIFNASTRCCQRGGYAC